MSGQVKTLTYEIANSPNVIGLTLEEIPCIIPDVPQTYIMNLKQSEVPYQLIQINKDDAQLLGLCNTKKTNSLTSSLKQPLMSSTNNIVNLKLLNNSVIFTSDSVSDCSFPKKEIIEKPLGSCENPIEIIQNGEKLQSTQNLSEEHLQQIAEALQQFHPTEKQEREDPSQDYIYEYEIVYPDELDIKPLLATHPKKTKRAKKRPVEHTLSVIPKKVRTRSGRITKPPRYIEKDCKSIENAEDAKITKTTPKTELLKDQNNEEPVQQINMLEYHSKRRQIPAQYRCPKCKKAYMGHSRMLKHLEQNPSHGKIPDSCKLLRDNQTWNFLINLALKCPIGKRGIKFCNELTNVLRNAKELAKILFKKPMACDKDLFYIEKDLGAALGIECGKYCLNEAEIVKDVSIISLLDNFIVDKELENVNNDKNENNSLSAKVEINYDENSNNLDTFTSKDIHNSLVTERDLSEITSNLLSDLLKTETSNYNNTFEECLITNNEEQVTHPTLLDDVSLKKDAVIKRNTHSVIRKRLKKKIAKKNILSEENTPKERATVSKCSQVEEKYKNPFSSSSNSSEKTRSTFSDDNIFNFCKFKMEDAPDNLLESSIEPSSYGNCITPNLDFKSSQELTETNTKNGEVENMTSFVENVNLDNNHQFVAENTNKENKSINSSPERGEFEMLSPCKSISINLLDHKQDSGDFSLLSSVIKQENNDFHGRMSLSSDLLVANSLLNTSEDLMSLSNVPSFLDNSASSDEIMNVDQFVNERFKNITEPELDLGNPSINLDLQTMDLFPFGPS